MEGNLLHFPSVSPRSFFQQRCFRYFAALMWHQRLVAPCALKEKIGLRPFCFFMKPNTQIESDLKDITESQISSLRNFSKFLSCTTEFFPSPVPMSCRSIFGSTAHRWAHWCLDQRPGAIFGRWLVVGWYQRGYLPTQRLNYAPFLRLKAQKKWTRTGFHSLRWSLPSDFHLTSSLWM